MIDCLQNIVPVAKFVLKGREHPNELEFDIWQAPEIKYKGIASMTDEKYVRGRNLLLAVREMALWKVQERYR